MKRKVLLISMFLFLLFFTKINLRGDGWNTRTACPGARRYAGGCAVQYQEAGTTATYIYVIGGDNAGMGSGLTNTTYRYAPLSNTWSTMSPMPFYAYDFGVESGIRDNTVRLYAFGGYDGGYRNQIYEYTPTTNTWLYRRNMSISREGTIQIGKVGGKLYAIGGDNGSILNLNEEYDPSTNGLVTKAAETQAAGDQAVASVGDSVIFCIGGVYDLSWSYTRRTNYMYKPAAGPGSWATKALRSDSACGAVAAYFNDTIYVFSGGNFVHYLTAVERYSVFGDNWVSNGAPMSAVQDGAVCGVIPNNLYKPTAFNLLAPDSGTTVVTLQPTLTWDNSERTKGPRIWLITGGTTQSAGSNPSTLNRAYTISSDTSSANDTLLYTLYYTLDATYTTCDSILDLLSPTYTFTSDLIADTIYYWKVKRSDYYEGTERWSNQLDWWFRTYNPTSIELSSFSAWLHYGDVKLLWRTESEKDNMRWLIERAFDRAVNFTLIQTLDGQGNKPTPTDYSFTDKNVAKEGKYFYRLGSVNTKGETEWHGPVTAYFKIIVASDIVSVIPSSKGKVKINYIVGNPSQTRIELYDLSGRRIETLLDGKKEAGKHSLIWNGGMSNGMQSSTGIYFCRIQSASFSRTVKFIYVK